MTPPTTTASAQSTLEEVKELAKHQNDNACAMCCSRECTQCAVLFSFPSIASLVESQAKRIEELEKALRESNKAFSYINKACLCDRGNGFDYGQKHPSMGQAGGGQRWTEPREMIRSAMKLIQKALPFSHE